jgi:hypothetical protein
VDDLRIRTFYRLSAWCLIAAFVGNFLLFLMFSLLGPQAFEKTPSIVKFILGIVGAAGAFGFFALWLGMIWYCLAVWRVGIAKKIGWFLLLLVTMPLGSLVYYFVVFEQAKTTGQVTSSPISGGD